ncbi:MAG: HNH endonuclease [Terriglobales bacterium]
MVKENWTRDELILAFNLYCKIPFGKIHIRNPQIISLAKAIQRTPSAVSWKLANFARLDPTLKSRRIHGATHGSRAEEDIWNEFNGNWEALAFESERLLAKVTGRDITQVAEFFPEGRSTERAVFVRVNQSFFRSAVLAAYDSKCCITGLTVPELLTASHIIPWSVDERNRTNPRNGLCLNATHDRAFDCGLLTITPEYHVRLSPVLKPRSKDPALTAFLLQYGDKKVALPERFRPEPAFLEYHNRKVFRAS